MNLDRFLKKAARHRELEGVLGDPAAMQDQARYQQFAKEFSDLTPEVEAFQDYQKTCRQISELETLLKESHDKELRELAESELTVCRGQREEQEDRLRAFLLPREEQEDRAVILEIRAGTGGQEAGLFAGDLYRMYCRFAEKKGWKVELMSSHESEAGGFKEIIFSMRGRGAAKQLKWESGVHRVQRVPTTEASGRIHTSAATVAVLLEPEEVDIHIDPKDLKIDVFRSSGPGGQSVNTTDSAIRVTHLPTGVVVVCQDERSQLKNKMKAMRVLRARLLDKMRRDAQDRESRDRQAKVGTGDRSEKIRTYNYPDRRVTDHRIGFTTHQLVGVMDGDLDEITGALIKAEIDWHIQEQGA